MRSRTALLHLVIVVVLVAFFPPVFAASNDVQALAGVRSGDAPGHGVDVPTDLGGERVTLEPPSGHGWKPLKLYGGSITAIAVSPVDPNFVVALNGYFFDTGRSIFVSHDGGKSWSGPPFSSASFNAAAFDAAFKPNGTLYIATYGGLLSVSPDFSTWTTESVNLGPTVNMTYFFRVAFNPKNPDEIWLGTQESIGNLSPLPHVVRSLDAGAHWTDVTPPFSDGGVITGIAFNPEHPERVIVVAGNLGVWRTLNDGATWSSANSGVPLNAPLNNVVHDGSRFYICGGSDFSNAPNVGIYASSDDGDTWTPEHRVGWPTRVIYQLAADPTQPGTVLAATQRGVFRRTNGAWTFGLSGLSSVVLSAALTPGNPDRIFAGNENIGVRRSEDGGVSFVNSSEGIRTMFVNSVVSNPENPLELAASFGVTDRGGVFTSVDGGESWNRQTLPPLRFTALEFGPGGVLYAVADWKTGSLSEGLYRRNGDGSWTSLGPSGVFPTNYSVYSVRVARHEPNTIYACGTEHHFQHPCIWRSTNGGASWNLIYTDPVGDAITEMQILNDGTDENILVSRFLSKHLLISHDGGDTWSEVPGVPAETRSWSLRGTPADPSTFYVSGSALSAGQYAPCLRSVDGGETWTPLAPREFLDKIDVDRVNADVVYGFRQRGVPILARSVDGGETYAPFDDGFDGLICNDLAWIEGPCPRLLLASDSGAYGRAIDSRPPQLSLSLEPNVLWPPDHRLKTIRAHVGASDGCDPNATFALKSIAVENGSGTAEDVVARIGEGTTTFQLRAERAGKGDRRYLVTYTATDASGNTAEATAVVLVPHDQSGPALSGGADQSRAPRTTELVSIEPNPFNPSTAVMITLARAQVTTVDVYDVRGARVRTLQTGMLPAGQHRIAWDGADDHGRASASGVYFFRFVAGSYVKTMKALLIK